MALNIIESTPSDGSLLDLNDGITLKFSSDVDSDSLNKDTIKIFSESTNSISYKISYDSINQKALIDIDSYVDPGAEILVFIKKTVKDIAGESLEYSRTFSYSVKRQENLDRPLIISPQNLSSVKNLQVKIETVEQAEVYTIEAAESVEGKSAADCFKEELVLKRNVIDSIQLQNTMDSDILIESEPGILKINMPTSAFIEGREYFIRVKARDMVRDTTQATVIMDYYDLKENTYFLGNDIYEVDLGSEYLPIEDVQSLRISSNEGSSFILNENYLEIDEYSSKIRFDISETTINFSDINEAVFSFEYGISLEQSEWSDYISFYYEDLIDLSDELSSLIADGNDELIEIISPEKDEMINNSIESIIFEIDGVESADEVNVDIKSEALNGYTFIETDDEIEYEIVYQGENRFQLNFMEALLDNNIINIYINSRDSYAQLTLITKINPFYLGVDGIRKSEYSELIFSYFDTEDIVSKIFENSLYLQKISENNDIDLSSESIELNVSRYIFYKSSYDLLFFVYLQSASTTSYDLGDFSLKHSSFKDIEPFLNMLKQRYEDELAEILDGGETTTESLPESFIKGEGTYLLNSRNF